MAIKLFKTLFILSIGIVLGVFFTKTDNLISKKISNVTTVEASGYAEFFLDDHHADLDPEIYGTPNNPLKTDEVPLWNRTISSDGSRYRANLLNSQNHSTNRADVFGTIKVRAEDLTPFDSPDSQDNAELEANFQGPNGESFTVILTRVIPEFSTNGPWPEDHFHGGVAINSHAQDHSVFSFLTIRGVADVYRDGELIDTDRLLSMTVSTHPRKTEDDLIIHFILMSIKVTQDNDYIYENLKTGIFSEDGEEQNWFHVNFYENIKITGNPLFE